MAERMCNRMAIINDGKFLAAGTVRGLKQNSDETLEDVFIRLVGKSMRTSRNYSNKRTRGE